MQISIQNLAKSQIELNIEVSAEKFKNFIEKVTFELGKVEKNVGKDKILKEAAQKCIQENYWKAISEKKLEVLGQPQIEILKLAEGNPFQFKAKVAILPEVKLPDYKNIASQVKEKEVQVSDQDIQRLKAEKEKQEKERVRQEIIEKVAENSEVDIPQILVDSEKSRLLGDLKKQVPQILQISFEEYLKKINKTEQELSDSFLEEAQRRVKNFLVLKEIEKKENIEAGEEEVKAEVDRISKIYPNSSQDQLRIYAEEVIRNEKTLQILENLTKYK